MGLTIHYTMYPEGAAISREQVGALVEMMQTYAIGMFDDGLLAEVSEVRHFTGAEMAEIAHNPQSEWMYPIISAQHVLLKQKFYTLAPAEAFIFRTWPGEGSEPANYGLVRYDEVVEGWRWASFCKTVYAQDPLTAHLTVVTMLDFIREELGLTVEVHDEGGFWKTRDLKALAKAFSNDRKMLAALAGSLKDTLGSDNVSAPIINLPDFERLEFEGNRQYPHMRKLAAALAKLSVPSEED